MSAAATTCTYCGHGDGIFIARKEVQQSVEAFFHADFSLYHCRECGLYYSWPMDQRTLDGLGRYFAEFYNNKDRIYDPKTEVGETWRPTPIRDALRRIYRSIRPHRDFPLGRAGEAMAMLQARGVRTLLDVGCSYGAFVRSAMQHGIECYGVEPNEEVVAVMRGRGIEAVSAGFFPDETGPLPRYDAVTFFQVLMYLHDISPTFFRKCRDILNPGGSLIVFGSDPRHRGSDEIERAMRVPLVVNFTGEEFMRRAATDAGFSSYEYAACKGEPTSCFHLLTA